MAGKNTPSLEMTPQNRDKLAARVRKAAEASLAAKSYVSAIDVLVGMDWLEPQAVERWRRGQIDYLERVVHANLSRISAAMKLFRIWAAQKGLFASETAYVRRRQRQPLRFSKSGHPTIEKSYRTHWVSKQLSETKRRRLEEARHALDPAEVEARAAGPVAIRDGQPKGASIEHDNLHDAT